METKKEKKIDLELVTSYICKGSDIGVFGNMFGGTMVCIVDDAAASYAAQVCDSPKMVTVKIDELVFKNPVKVGNILKTYATVKEFGRTSVTLYIEVRRHSVHTGGQEVVLHTNIKFVRIEGEGKAIPILEYIKSRYNSRMAKYGRGLLSGDEIQNEKNG